MAKTQEELNALKEEVETLNEKLHELTEDELAQVSGGSGGVDPVQLLKQLGFDESVANKLKPKF